MCTLAEQHPIAVIGLKTALEDGVIARLERKAVKRTALIYDFIASSPEPVTMKQIKDQFDIKYGIASGTLSALLASNKLVREQVSRADGSTGRKVQWGYKALAQTEKNMVESLSE